MLALLQRVKHASVVVEDEKIATIGIGVLVFLAVEPADTRVQADRMLERILGYRMFSDVNGRMNLSVHDVDGGVLLVPQFTLAADTSRGMRPSFTSAAEPKFAQEMFDYVVNQASEKYANVASGKFGADMQISLCNDGPVTFLLKI